MGYKYTKKADRLLSEAIQIWKDRKKDRNFEECPLCDVYADKHCSIDEECRLCPIAVRAKNTGCHGTPYFENGGRFCEWEAFQYYCDKEIQFLEESLIWLRQRSGGPLAKKEN